jgi:exopolyphosphatase
VSAASAFQAERRPGEARRGRVAVVDIGSNSIRLVVFDGLKRAPFPLFNEKVMCGLGRGLERTGELNADGAAMALDNLGRFVTLADVMGADRIDLLATAAVRDASNGPDFVRKAEKACGRRVRVLSGEEEARLSAMGVLMGMPQATGVMGDLGGGSLELVALERGKPGAHATLPLGPLRLAEAAGEDMRKAADLVDAALEPLGWLGDLKGEIFHPVGGAWRTLARIHMEQTGYPLHVIQDYRVPRREMEEMARLIAGMGRKSLARLVDVARRRLEALPFAALVLERVLKAGRPSTVAFSAFGLREGHIYDLLPATERARDPLLSMCEDIAEALGRFGSPDAAEACGLRAQRLRLARASGLPGAAFHEPGPASAAVRDRPSGPLLPRARAACALWRRRGGGRGRLAARPARGRAAGGGGGARAGAAAGLWHHRRRPRAVAARQPVARGGADHPCPRAAMADPRRRSRAAAPGRAGQGLEAGNGDRLVREVTP